MLAELISVSNTRIISLKTGKRLMLWHTAFHSVQIIMWIVVKQAVPRCSLLWDSSFPPHQPILVDHWPSLLLTWPVWDGELEEGDANSSANLAWEVTAIRFAVTWGQDLSIFKLHNSIQADHLETKHKFLNELWYIMKFLCGSLIQITTFTCSAPNLSHNIKSRSDKISVPV